MTDNLEQEEYQKYCRYCQQYLLAMEHFSKDRRSRDGFQDRCKSCYRVYREANRERILRQKQEHYLDNRESIITARRKKYYENRDEILRQRRKHYAENREHILKCNRRWLARNPEKMKRIRERHRLYLLEYNPGYYARNKQREQQRHREWRSNNLDKKRFIEARRRSRKQQLPHDFTADDWNRCLEYWGHGCAVCGNSEDLEADHWIPISDDQCPGTIPGNIVVLCKSCNSQKCNQSPKDWLMQRFDEQEAVTIFGKIKTYLAEQ